MSEESWTDELELPRTERVLTRLIDTAEATLEGIDTALESGAIRDTPELRQMLLDAKAKAAYCLENFREQLAERRRLMDEESGE